MRKRRFNGFTAIEVLATIVILTILIIIFIGVFKEALHKGECIEWEDVKVSDCWSYGMGTECEHYIEKRCVKYDD